MHHMIAPYQSIVYPSDFKGEMAAAMSHSNKTVAFNKPGCSLFIFFSYYSNYVSNFIYIFNYLNKLFTDYLHPFVHNIHCIATHIITGIHFSPRFGIFYFEFKSQMNLVSSLFF